MQRKLWSIPSIWPWSTVYVIGGGPSVADARLDLITKERVIGVNQAFRLGPWIDVLYFGDFKFYGDNIHAIRKFGGLKISSCSQMPPEGKGWPGILRVGRSHKTGIETNKSNFVAWNGNSGASAISVAYWLGAKKIVLIGFDMHPDANGRHNYHDYYPRRPDKWNPYPEHMKGWNTIAKAAARRSVEIINTTIGSSISEFPIKRLEDVVRGL